MFTPLTSRKVFKGFLELYSWFNHNWRFCSQYWINCLGGFVSCGYYFSRHKRFCPQPRRNVCLIFIKNSHIDGAQTFILPAHHLANKTPLQALTSLYLPSETVLLVRSTRPTPVASSYTHPLQCVLVYGWKPNHGGERSWQPYFAMALA